LDSAADRQAVPVWLQPSQALERFEPQQVVRQQSGLEARARTRYGLRVGGLNLMVRVGAGTEVVPMMTASRIPNSVRWLLGVINLRGNLVPVFDLAKALDLEANTQAARSGESGAKMILVFGAGDKSAGLVIDGFPVALAGLRPTQVSALDSRIATHVGDAFANDDEIWIELIHETLFERLAQAHGL